MALEKGKKIWPSKTNLSDIEIAAKWIFYQVIEGMIHLHDDLGICHRDLKHDNILMGRRNAGPESEDERQETVKVCDFTTA